MTDFQFEFHCVLAVGLGSFNNQIRCFPDSTAWSMLKMPTILTRSRRPLADMQPQTAFIVQFTQKCSITLFPNTTLHILLHIATVSVLAQTHKQSTQDCLIGCGGCFVKRDINSINWLIDADSFNNELMDRVKKVTAKTTQVKSLFVTPHVTKTSPHRPVWQ